MPMDDFVSTLPAWAIVLGSIFALILALLWILLPFAVFGLKYRLNEIIKANKRTNALLEQLAARTSPL